MWKGVEVRMRVGCPFPPVRNDAVTPRHLLLYFLLEFDYQVFLRLGRLGWQAMFASDLNRAWDLATIFMCHKEVPQMKHLYKKQKQLSAVSIAEKDLLEVGYHSSHGVKA